MFISVYYVPNICDTMKNAENIIFVLQVALLRILFLKKIFINLRVNKREKGQRERGRSRLSAEQRARRGA